MTTPSAHKIQFARDNHNGRIEHNFNKMKAIYVSILATLTGAYADTAFVSNAKGDVNRPAFVSSASALNVATLPHVGSGDSSVESDETLFFASLTTSILQDQVKVSKKKSDDGPLAPIVVLVRDALGEQQFNKLRGNAISLHTAIIRKFISSSESSFGDFVLRTLFLAADKDADGLIHKNEMKRLLHSLGFTWLGDSQLQGIFERANVQVPDHISLEEFVKEAPKTLSTNLVKLAKKNGGSLGLLA